jgi:hypothetical protein
MKLEFKKDKNDIIVRIELSENTYIEKKMTKEEALSVSHRLKTLLINFN